MNKKDNAEKKLLKKLYEGIRYQKINEDNHAFYFYSPSGELIDKQTYLFYDIIEATLLFKQKIKQNYLGMFDYSDLDIDN